MAIKSSIEWTESTWNPVTGCTKISLGCKNCYAERMAMRLHAMGQPNYRNAFKVTTHPQVLNLPLKWKKPQTIFVNSMSDLFHREVPTKFILQIFDTMIRADWHCYQVLTKRSERLMELNDHLSWRPHIWMGVTVESADYVHRIDDLRKTSVAIKFISLEPLLGPLPRLNLEGIDWVIVGGESGPRSRLVKKEWVEDICEQCCAKGIPFFFKQWGGANKKKAGKMLNGRIWNQMPSLVEALV
ncbi:MAG: phage Gp37/Gp68 family protein [Candidatus Omnitrophota bacterium]